jgi:hypothetical protein
MSGFLSIIAATELAGASCWMRKTLGTGFPLYIVVGRIRKFIPAHRTSTAGDFSHRPRADRTPMLNN